MIGCLFLLAFVLLFGLFSIDGMGVSTIDKMHLLIKENKTITIKELTDKLGYDYKIYNEGKLKRYVWMKHSTGVPVRFLTVYFDEDKFVRHEFSVGWKDVE